MFSIDYIKEWSESYKTDLTTNIMPFWLKYGLDKVNGGIYTCVDRNGSLMDTTKSVWFQGRFAFICSYAYNNIEKNEAWLAAAKSTIDFIEAHCFDSDGRMYFEVTAEGTPLRKRRYIFSESFAAIAMSEYAIASGDQTYAVKALDLFKRMQYFMETPGILPPKYLDTLPMKGHSITMILINVASRIRQAIQDESFNGQIDASIAQLRKDFMHPEFKALLETVGPHGEFIDSNMGRTINPGHCIETAWFLLKFWWPQTEAIIATLYAYLATGNEKYLDMHKQISDWTYTHFPDKECGEWFGYLHRDGTPAQMAKGNLFKGPFHIPRMMIKGYTLCKEILDNKKSHL